MVAEWTQERHDKCKQVIAKATPGPWFGNSYGEMFSAKDCTCWPDDPEGGEHFKEGCPYYDSEDIKFPLVPKRNMHLMHYGDNYKTIDVGEFAGFAEGG